MDITCYILIALGLVLGFIGGWSLWFAVVRYWARRVEDCERSLRVYDIGQVSKYWLRYPSASKTKPTS